MLAEAAFYHLARTSVEAVLPRLLAKAYAGGARVLVRAQDEDLARLDSLLWTYEAGSFLPHGRDEAQGEQPILLVGADSEPMPRRDIVVSLVPPFSLRDEDCLRFLILFSADDAPSLTAARAAWKDFSTRTPPVKCAYWRQAENGGWVRDR